MGFPNISKEIISIDGTSSLGYSLSAMIHPNSKFIRKTVVSTHLILPSIGFTIRSFMDEMQLLVYYEVDNHVSRNISTLHPTYAVFEVFTSLHTE